MSYQPPAASGTAPASYGSPTGQPYPPPQPYQGGPTPAGWNRQSPPPAGVTLTGPGRRFAGFLLDLLLAIVTLVIGWFVWSLFTFREGQTPAKRLLHMRVVNTQTNQAAGFGRMALREWVGKTLVQSVSGATFGILYFWLLWDDNNQELWDKLASTIVVDDPHDALKPTQAGQAGQASSKAAPSLPPPVPPAGALPAGNSAGAGAPAAAATGAAASSPTTSGEPAATAGGAPPPLPPTATKQTAAAKKPGATKKAPAVKKTAAAKSTPAGKSSPARPAPAAKQAPAKKATTSTAAAKVVPPAKATPAQPTTAAKKAPVKKAAVKKAPAKKTTG